MTATLPDLERAFVNAHPVQTINTEVMKATLTEFHSQSSTGKGGGMLLPD